MVVVLSNGKNSTFFIHRKMERTAFEPFEPQVYALNLMRQRIQYIKNVILLMIKNHNPFVRR